MSREDVIAVGVRLFAVYGAFTVLRNVPAVAQMWSIPDGAAWTAFYVTALFVGALICVLLWFFPLSIARKLLPVMREPRSEASIGEPVALSLGLALIGVWLFAYASTDAVYWFTYVVLSKQLMQGVDVPMEWTHEQIANVVATLVQLSLSLWLIFGSAGLRRLIYRFRYGEA